MFIREQEISFKFKEELNKNFDDISDLNIEADLVRNETLKAVMK
jgi:hypothetical protein